jgi:hypothetical protein
MTALSVPCPVCQAPRGTRCSPQHEYEETCERRVQLAEDVRRLREMADDGCESLADAADELAGGRELTGDERAVGDALRHWVGDAK